MKTIETRLAKIGNSRGIRLPAPLIARLGFDGGPILLEERDGELVLKPKQAPKKLSWEETYKEMAASDEDWSDWESLTDGWYDE